MGKQRDFLPCLQLGEVLGFWLSNSVSFKATGTSTSGTETKQGNAQRQYFFLAKRRFLCTHMFNILCYPHIVSRQSCIFEENGSQGLKIYICIQISSAYWNSPYHLRTTNNNTNSKIAHMTHLTPVICQYVGGIPDQSLSCQKRYILGNRYWKAYEIYRKMRK